jgi:exonuclease VII small subunit
MRAECWQIKRVAQMGKVLPFNDVRKARGPVSSTGTCSDRAGQCSEEIRAKLTLWVAELTAVITHLERVLGAFNARIDFLPAGQSKLDLENQRVEIVIEIGKARRLLAEL